MTSQALPGRHSALATNRESVPGLLADITVENFGEHTQSFAEAAGLGALANAENELRLDIIADRSAGESWGVNKTPTVFVGTLRFIELFGVEEIITAIDKELKSLA